jgi:hypothetical protein
VFQNNLSRVLLAGMVLVSPLSGAGEEVWSLAEQNGDFARKTFIHCRDYVHGWLAHADPESGLIPRNLDCSRDFWNGKDAAADNYAFMVLASSFTDRDLFEGKMRDMLEAETRLTSRLDNLVDDYSFSRKGWRIGEPDLVRMTFSSSEYVKDGLMPLTEWLGKSPWSERMIGLVDSILDHASVDTAVGILPATDFEVGGELMQVLARLFWMTGNERYREFAFRYADYFLFHDHPTRREELSLDDHGCEVIGGLSEVYYLAAKTDADRHKKYRAPMHEMLDRILEVGRDENGLFHKSINPVTGTVLEEELTDNWGYDYNAYLTVAEVDDHEPYLEAVRFVLENVHNQTGYPWEGGSADGYADSIESGINLLNRIPVNSGFEWVEHETLQMLEKQDDDGIIAGWHGDGNYTRTAIMVALWKSQGCQIQPWRADVSMGAVEEDGNLYIAINSRWPWEGELLFDRPRHKQYLGIPTDYARLNQFPEWFTVEQGATYQVTIKQGERKDKKTMSGSSLIKGLPIALDKDGMRIRVYQN